MSAWCRRNVSLPPQSAQHRERREQHRRCGAKTGAGGGGACPSHLMRFLLCTWRRALATHHAAAAITVTFDAPPQSLELIEEPMRTAALDAWRAGQRVYACAELEVAFARPPRQQEKAEEEEEEEKEEEKRAFAAMCAWMHVVRHWTRCGGGGGDMGPLRVRMIWTDLRKTRRSTDPRGPEQANGGLAFGCGRAELVVYRREEWWKVFLHETLHSLELDGGRAGGATRDTDPTAWFEAFTECWARLWYLAWTAVTRYPSAAMQERAFQQLLAESQMFGWAQAARWNDDAGKEPDAMQQHVDAAAFQEQTAGRMYFTAATALLCNLGALHRFTAAAHIMRPRGTNDDGDDDDDMDDLAELIRAAVRSPTAARLRREVRLRPPPPVTPPHSMRMTHLDASPEIVAAIAVRGGGAQSRRRRSIDQTTRTRTKKRSTPAAVRSKYLYTVRHHLPGNDR